MAQSTPLTYAHPEAGTARMWLELASHLCAWQAAVPCSSVNGPVLETSLPWNALAVG